MLEILSPLAKKLQKIEADQLIQLLRASKKEYRYNIFTQQIEQEERKSLRASSAFT